MVTTRPVSIGVDLPYVTAITPANKGLAYQINTIVNRVQQELAAHAVAINNLPPGNLAAGVNASASTFWRGDGTWATPGSGTVNGPGASTVNDFALWNNTSGTLLLDANATTVTALLNVFTSALKGLVPASGGGTTTFLRADGSFATPAGGGNVTGPGVSVNNDIVTWNGTTGTIIADTSYATITSRLSVFVASGASHAIGLVPDPGAVAGTTRFLREDAVWSIPGGNLVYIATDTVSGGTLTDTTNLSGTFRSFLLVLRNILPGTGVTNLKLQVHSNAAYQTTSYVNSYSVNNGSGNIAGAASTTGIQLTGSGLITTGNGTSGQVWIHNPNSTTLTKGITSSCVSDLTVSGSYVAGGGFWNGGTTAIDGYQIVPSSGTLASGSVDIYGLP